MLKRQRSMPSFVPDAYALPEPAIDIFERAVKRRRQLSPPQVSLNKGKALWRPADSDGEEDIDTEEQAAGYLSRSEHAQRLEQAGEYKNVNSLLHDLHSEQRHRMLFSSNTLPSNLHIPGRPHSDMDYPYASFSNKLSPSAHGSEPLTVAPHESHRHASFTISISSKVDHVEVQRVTERYEDTNRFLGALFLSRRRQYDGQDSPNQA